MLACMGQHTPHSWYSQQSKHLKFPIHVIQISSDTPQRGQHLYNSQTFTTIRHIYISFETAALAVDQPIVMAAYL